jgi:hypothetical protein
MWLRLREKGKNMLVAVTSEGGMSAGAVSILMRSIHFRRFSYTCLRAESPRKKIVLEIKNLF